MAHLTVVAGLLWILLCGNSAAMCLSLFLAALTSAAERVTIVMVGAMWLFSVVVAAQLARQ